MQSWLKWTIGLICATGVGVGLYFLFTTVKCDGSSKMGAWGQVKLKSGKVNVETEQEWMMLCNNYPSDTYIQIRDAKFYKKNITEYVFGEVFTLEKIPDNFLYKCDNLSKLSRYDNKGHLPLKIKEIGDNFLRDTKYNVPIILPETITKIGNNFLRNTSIKSSFKLPPNIERIDQFFLADCIQLNGPFRFPDSLSKTYGSTRGIGEGIFYNCYSFKNDIYYNLVTYTDFEVTTQPWEEYDWLQWPFHYYPSKPRFGTASFAMSVPYSRNYSFFNIVPDNPTADWLLYTQFYFGTIHDYRVDSYSPSHKVGATYDRPIS
ncbi:MAG: hypothetical protein Ta2E_05420 [Mycoplasmoidaceae bacterium]|nr:MAG: hypothetical protein Ta2E_05420 [Mycoplasmoidaceae bacterium]